MADQKGLKSWISGVVPTKAESKVPAQSSQAVVSPSSSKDRGAVCRMDSSPSRTSSSSCDDFVQVHANDCNPVNDSQSDQGADSDDSSGYSCAGAKGNLLSDLLDRKQPSPASVLKSARKTNTPSADLSPVSGRLASHPTGTGSGMIVVESSKKRAGTFSAPGDVTATKHEHSNLMTIGPPLSVGGTGSKTTIAAEAAMPSYVDIGCETDGSPSEICFPDESVGVTGDRSSWSMLPPQVELRSMAARENSWKENQESVGDLAHRTQNLGLSNHSSPLHLKVPNKDPVMVDDDTMIRNGESSADVPKQVELSHLSSTAQGMGGNHESFEDLENRTRKIRQLKHIPPPASTTTSGNSLEVIDPMSMSGFSSIETVSSLSSNASDASLGSESEQQAAKDFQEWKESQDKERVIQGMQASGHRHKFFKHINNKMHGHGKTKCNIDSTPKKSEEPARSPGEGSYNVLARRRHSATPAIDSTPIPTSHPPWHHHHHGHRHGHKHRNRQHVSDRNFGAENLEQRIERETEKMKTKMMSVWNNVKYGWTLKTTTNFRYDSAIWLLGRLYHKRPDDEDDDDVWNPNRPTGTPQLPSMEKFKRAFSSIIWFTYRRQFPALAGTKLTTDCGWGCMLRSCQMMVAQALVTHFLGSDWDMYGAQTREDLAYHRTIISWFGDHPSDKAPFSIHNLATIGQSLDKNPGDWYGPASVAHIFRSALIKGQTPIPLLDQVSIYVAQDCTMYKQDVLDASLGVDADLEDRPGETSDKNQEWRRAVILLIPVRLGGETINEMYVPCVQNMLAHKNCLGIIGGKPRHSLYFVGWQDNKLVYLDPHFCQDVVDCFQPDFPIESYHCMSPRKLPFLKMDPSCTIGFYCQTREEFDALLSHINEMVIPPKQKGQYPLFIMSEGRSIDVEHAPTTEEGRLRIRRIVKDREGRVRSMTTDSEDFIVLGQTP